MIDLTLLSDEDVHNEYWRRRRAIVATAENKGGRPRKLRPCPKCGAQLGHMELRTHQPSCEPVTAYFIDTPKRTTKTTGNGHREYVTAAGIRLAWSNPGPLPAIDSTVDVTMNSIGLVRVVGYFCQGGYLGVMTRPLHPPKWLVKQRKECSADAPQWAKDGIICTFGREITSIATPAKRRHK